MQMRAFEISATVVLCLRFSCVEAGSPPGCLPKGAPFAEAAVPKGNVLQGPRETEVYDAAQELRGLQRGLEELEKKAKAILPKDRTDWEFDQSLQLAQRAKEARCERDLLEVLLRSLITSRTEATAHYWDYDMRQKVLFALACLILQDNLVGREKDHLLRASLFPNEQADVHGVLHAWCRTPGDFFGTALAAIDSYEDERARNFLLSVALTSPRAGKFLGRTEWALRFLACYDPRAIEPKLRATYEAPVPPIAASHGAYMDMVCALLDELRYIRSLDAAGQRRYQRISRMLARAYAVAPQHSRAPLPTRYTVRAWTLDWQEGDERFIPHMIEMRYARGPRPPTIWAEGVVAPGGPISAKGLAWLKQQAESGDWPARVKKELGRLVRARENAEQSLPKKTPIRPRLPEKDKPSE